MPQTSNPPLLTAEQHNRACENRARALVKLYDKGHTLAFTKALEKWLDDVERAGGVRDEESVLAEIPTAATRQEREEEAILAEIPTAATRQELWNVIRAARLDAEHNSCAEEYWKGEEDAV